MVIQNTGNVGIGTTGPGAKLEVAGQVKITGGNPGANKVLTSDATGLATWETLSTIGGITGSGAAGQVTFWTGASSVSGNNNFFWDNTNLRLGIGTSTPAGLLHVATGTVDALVVESVNGNVGIGTTGPEEKLHIGSGRIKVGAATFLEAGKLSVAPNQGTLEISADRLELTRNGVQSLRIDENGLGSVVTISGNSTNSFHRLRIAVPANVTGDALRIEQSTNTTGGSQKILNLIGAASTGLTADTEAIDVDINLGRTVQFTAGGGTFTNQRAVVIRAPTYSATAAETITNAATVAITGAPSAGTNMTITNPYALWVDSGTTRFDGDVHMAVDTGNVGIGTTAPNSSAILHLSSTTKGFLPPQMTTTQRDAISSPPAGLIIYNTTTNKINFFNGTSWEQVTSS
jgi:hypothetical protein